MTAAERREQLRAWQRQVPGSFTALKEAAQRRGMTATQARATARRSLAEAVARSRVVESAPTPAPAGITPPTKPLHELAQADRDAHAARVAEAAFGHFGAEDEPPAAEPQQSVTFGLEPDKPLHTMSEEESWLYRIGAVSSSISFGGRR